MADQDWDLRNFVHGAEVDSLHRPRRTRLLLLIAALALIGCGIFWAANAPIEEVARAGGRIIPSGKARVVESLEGGILSDLAVAEGDAVKAGQVLARIDDTSSAANLGELQAQAQALRARDIRLAAELEGQESLDFGAGTIAPDSPVALAEIASFEARVASTLGQRAVLEAQAAQRQQEITEIEAALARVGETLELLEEEIVLKETSGVVPRAQILPLERELTTRRQERDSLLSRLEQARFSLTEAQARLQEAELLRRAEINLERSATRAELAVIDESLKSASDVVSRTALRAPVAGLVSALNVNTRGSVIAPGEEILRIVPQDEGLLVEARLRPEDVAFVRPGLSAQVKLTAFDFTIYGSLDGLVQRIGADAQTDEATGEVYFPIYVETIVNYLERGAERHDIRPGMVAEVDILTGERMVLDYLLKPFRKARLEALRER